MTILAFDPGGTTGYACLAKTPRGLILEAVGAFAYRELQTGPDVWDIIRTCKPSFIILEDWENQGKRIDMHSTWPNRVIGHIEAYASLLGIHLCRVPASTWKPSFARHAGHLPKPPAKLDAPHMRIAKRLRLELGAWPEALIDAPQDTLRHVIDAAGLACWLALHPQMRAEALQ